MVGLRERQKAGRREAIVEAAVQLFEQNGYEETTIQQIADRAELTVTTVYRYFRSKADFLVELNKRLEKEIELDCQRVLANLPTNPVSALAALLGAQVGLGPAGQGNNLHQWRSITSEVMRSPELFGAAFHSRDLAIIRQLKDACAILQAWGSLKSDIDVNSFAVLLNVIVRGAVRIRLGAERSDKTLAKQLRRHVEISYLGICSESHSKSGS